MEDEELEAIRIESTHTIDIESFVPRDQVDERYLDTPYYIAPDDKVAQEAFAVIRDAMQEKGRAGIARVVMARRERMILLEPLGKGIVATLLRYPYEVRGEDAYFESIPDLKLPAEMKNLAGHIIETKAADFDPSQFEDRYEKAVVDLIQSKQGGRTRKRRKPPSPPTSSISWMRLRKSVDADRPAGKTKKQCIKRVPVALLPSRRLPNRQPARAGRRRAARPGRQAEIESPRWLAQRSLQPRQNRLATQCRRSRAALRSAQSLCGEAKLRGNP